jgi:hypothetical protein
MDIRAQAVGMNQRGPLAMNIYRILINEKLSWLRYAYKRESPVNPCERFGIDSLTAGKCEMAFVCIQSGLTRCLSPYFTSAIEGESREPMRVARI